MKKGYKYSKVKASPDVADALGKNEERKVYSFFPIDPFDCDCFEKVQSWEKRLGEAGKRAQSMMDREGHIVCPRSKEDKYKQYDVVCNNCGETVAQVHSTDKRLTEWCNLHYVSWHDKNKWRGCFGINLSPIDGKPGFECTCGQDTRDFRTTKNRSKVYQQKKVENMEGREFGLSNSKFKLKKTK